MEAPPFVPTAREEWMEWIWNMIEPLVEKTIWGLKWIWYYGLWMLLLGFGSIFVALCGLLGAFFIIDIVMGNGPPSMVDNVKLLVGTVSLAVFGALGLFVVVPEAYGRLEQEVQALRRAGHL